MKYRKLLILSAVLFTAFFVFRPTSNTQAGDKWIGEPCDGGPEACLPGLICDYNEDERDYLCRGCYSTDECKTGSGVDSRALCTDTIDGYICINPHGNPIGAACGEDSKNCVTGSKCESSVCVKAASEQQKYTCNKGNMTCSQSSTGEFSSQTDCEKTCVKGGAGTGTTGGNDNYTGIDLTVQDISRIITGIACWGIGIVLAIMVIALLIAGLMYFLARGEPSKVTSARGNLNNVLIGIVIILATNIIIATIANAISSGSYSFIPLNCSQFK